jgi:uncharacterized delta-60 repeat protein
MKVLSYALFLGLLVNGCSKKNTSAPQPPSGSDTTHSGGTTPTGIHGYFVDSSFAPTGTFITLVAVQKDGKILIANPNGIGRINRDGTRDNSFAVGSASGGKIHCMALQDNGQILVGGSFLAFNGAARKYLVRLNADGSVDNSIATAIYDEANTDEDIRAIGFMKDGRILIGGDFFWKTGTANGGTQLLYNRAIACLKADGTFDPSWKDYAPRSGYYLPYYVDAIKVLDNGKIILAGGITFNDATGKAYSDIVRLNPDETIDASFAPDFVLHEIQDGAFVYSCIVPLKDGSILIGGGFNQLAFTNGTNKAMGGYVKLTQSGTVDPSFAYPLAGNIVDAVCPFSDSTILIGDRTDSTASKTYRVGLAALHPDGTLDASYTVKVAPTIQVYTIVKETDSSVLVGGQMGPYQYQNGYPVYTQGLMRIVKR